jgi:hypothetical protein
LPGGFVIPCLLPVMTTAVGFDLAASCTTGRNALTPLMTPKRLVWRVYTVRLVSSPGDDQSVDVPW